MKFCFAADPDAESYEIEVTGLPPGTQGQLAVSATSSAGTGPQSSVALNVPARIPAVPAAPSLTAQDGSEPPAQQAPGGEDGKQGPEAVGMQNTEAAGE
jgi:hypothetical protein